jgi:hypothetical protein
VEGKEVHFELPLAKLQVVRGVLVAWTQRIWSSGLDGLLGEWHLPS